MLCIMGEFMICCIISGLDMSCSCICCKLGKPGAPNPGVTGTAGVGVGTGIEVEGVEAGIEEAAGVEAGVEAERDVRTI